VKSHLQKKFCWLLELFLGSPDGNYSKKAKFCPWFLLKKSAFLQILCSKKIQAMISHTKPENSLFLNKVITVETI